MRVGVERRRLVVAVVRHAIEERLCRFGSELNTLADFYAGDTPAMLAAWPPHAASLGAWGGFAYVTVFSMWLGFFAWYRGLALGGTLRVSQVQLLQPFLTMVFAVPILGERLDMLTVAFGLAVAATVVAGRWMAAHSPRLA